ATIAASLDAVDLNPDRLLDALRQRDYPAVQVVVGQAVAEGPWSQVIEQWAAADTVTFERLLHPELAHLAIGVGDLRGRPLYVVLAASPAGKALERRTVALRERPDRVRLAILGRVNAERGADGQPPLSARRLLDRVAQRYAEAMLDGGFYGHTSPAGETVLDRVRATGYRPLRVGENIASGQTAGEQVMTGWMNSPDHRANILHPAFRELGVGVASGRGPDGQYRVYWVQVFADPR
ncbi:MAG: CAP domain-containing protein, partial [Acidobacteriota bacterium]